MYHQREVIIFSFVFIRMILKPKFCFLTVSCNTASCSPWVSETVFSQCLTFLGAVRERLPVSAPTFSLMWQWEPVGATSPCRGSLPLAILTPATQCQKHQPSCVSGCSRWNKQEVMGSEGEAMIQRGKWSRTAWLGSGKHGAPEPLSVHPLPQLLYGFARFAVPLLWASALRLLLRVESGARTRVHSSLVRVVGLPSVSLRCQVDAFCTHFRWLWVWKWA